MHRPKQLGKSKALFLDRDGVINVERCYLYRRDEFEFVEGIFELCLSAEALGYVLVIITNQAGIARGYYTEEQFVDLMNWVIEQFSERSITITGVYYCPFHPIHGIGKYRADSPDRKPRPGMLLRAAAELNLDLEASAMIGDRGSDVEAARAAGIGTRILLAPDAGAIPEARECCSVCVTLAEVRRRHFTFDGPSRPAKQK